MTTAQIITRAKRKIKKMVSPNEIISISFGKMFGDLTASVKMSSTCESGETMVWSFLIEYTPSNENIFTSLEKAEFPNLITKESLIVTLVK